MANMTTSPSSGSCVWTATSNSTWLSVTAPSFKGSSHIFLQAMPNTTGAPRKAIATIAGHAYLVLQDQTSATGPAAPPSTPIEPVKPRPVSLTITSLPNKVGGTVVNLTAATADWRLFSQPAATCRGSAGCYGDRSLSGSGIIGVYNNGVSDPNYYGYIKAIPALMMSWNDGTNVRSGTLTTNNLFQSNSYVIRAPADHAVTKTLTTYWSLYQIYGSGPTYSGTGTVRFTASLSDDSSASSQMSDVSVTQANQNGLLKVIVSYTATTDGQELILSAAKITTEDQNSILSPIAAMLDSPPTGPIVRHIPYGSDLQGELDAARPGDTLVFPINYSWIGNAVLSKRPVLLDGNGLPLPITVRAADINLAAGKRVKLSEATVTWTSPNTNPVLTGTGGNIGNWKFDGIRFASANPLYNGLSYGFVIFGLASIADHTTTTASLPHDISITHCVLRAREPIIHPDQSTSYYSQKVGILWDVLNGTIADNNITGFVVQSPPQEANAITIGAGTNVLIANNELSSSGEVIMLNGAYLGYSQSEALSTPINSGLMPDHIIVTGNYIYKDIAWIALGLTKNLVECKTCKNSRISANLLEYSFEGVYSDGQYGASIVVNSRNGGNTVGALGRPWQWTRNVEVDHNIQRHQGSCIQTAGPYDDVWDPSMLTHAVSLGMGRVSAINYHDNYCDDISIVWTTPSTLYPAVVPLSQAESARWGSPDNSTIQRNTFLTREQPNTNYPGGMLFGLSFNPYSTVPHGMLHMYDTGLDLPAPTSGTPLVTVGQLFDSNIFGWGDPECDGSESYGCFYDRANTIFTNNLMRNSTKSDWNTFLLNSNFAYPGKWTGNVLSSTQPAGIGVGAPAALLSGEVAIRSGGR